MVTTRPRTARRQGQDLIILSLTPDGRLRDEAVMARLLEAGRSATDCFLFCHGWAGVIDRQDRLASPPSWRVHLHGERDLLQELDHPVDPRPQ